MKVPVTVIKTDALYFKEERLLSVDSVFHYDNLLLFLEKKNQCLVRIGALFASWKMKNKNYHDIFLRL